MGGLAEWFVMWYIGWVPERYKRNPNTKCCVCQKNIYRRPFEIEKNRDKVFCGNACYGLSLRKEKPCIVCDAPILSGLNKKTCSRVCANKHRAGIHYKIGRPHDKVVSQRALKIRLVTERGTICERCNYDKTAILQVHHKNRNRDDNSMTNLALICPNCHFEEHYLEKSWLKNK